MLEQQLTTTTGDDPADDRQTEAATAVGGAGRFELREGLKRSLAIGVGDSRTVITDAQGDAVWTGTRQSYLDRRRPAS